MSQIKPAIILTVDVEDWPQSSWDRNLPLSDYCADNKRVLDLLSEFPNAHATFFILGKFAEKHPKTVKAIAQAGYEVASHGYGHLELFHLGRQGFAEDLLRSAEAICESTGIRPIGYRAPDFSVVGESLWAFEELAEQGYIYDTSIFPISKMRYGIANWPREAVYVRLQSGGTIL
jgi:peptidoglycan/xylan/chitin deacetylase (PgdA/CDA1 family)